MLHSASALGGFVECEHLAWLERQAALGHVPRPATDAGARLLWEKGQEHERAWLGELVAKGADVAVVEDAWRDPQAAADTTLAAMRKGTSFIYQGAFVDGDWMGIPDFLERVERPSALGAWSYEVVDTKLARRTKPHFLLQLCLYGELLARAQGAPPERLHVVLGTRQRESFRHADFAAYFRRLRGRYLAATAAGADAAGPLPVAFCGVCAWRERCEAAWEAGDHLCRVADIRRTQIVRLEAAGITTLTALAQAPDDAPRPLRLAGATFAALRRQARLQRAQADDGKPRYELLPPAPGRGFALLPPPSPGDVFFDMEGDPYFEGGLEYLFGATTIENGARHYRAWWAHDRDEERRAFEAFVDFVVERRRADPGLHVYHYAAYEPTALKRLAGRFGSREEELDDLLRGGVLVDLYRVVKQGLCISQPGYSIKKVEAFYRGEKRSGGVVDAAQSIVAYEKWLGEHDDAVLAGIELYNKDDCDSTLELREWLLERRAELPPEEVARAEEAARAAADALAEARAARAPKPEVLAEIAARAALAQDLVAATEQGAAPAAALLGHLLDYHRREARPAWWAFFARRAMTVEELIDDPESIAGLLPDPDVPPRPEAKSTAYAFRYEAQETKLGPGPVFDPATGEPAGEILSIDPAAGTLTLKRGPKFKGVPLPAALIPPGDPYGTKDQRAALLRLAEDVRERGLDAPGRYRALRDVLLRAHPRVAGTEPGAPLLARGDDVVEPDDAADVVRRLGGGHLFVQGPPGSGKTYLGARLIVRLIAEGRRVGVTATSHRAIHGLLARVEEVARDTGVSFRGFKKASSGNPESRFASPVEAPQIESADDLPAGTSYADFALVAGTAWLLCRAEFDQSLDVLFIDEAGQVALADALAMGTCATNIVLLGDPLQLPHVGQGTHPAGAGASVLAHLLGEDGTVPRERGLFLGRTWRMHPAVCRFISEAIYEGRLHAAPDRERQAIAAPGALTGSGLHFAAIEHAGNAQRSTEEADWIAARIADLLQGTFVDVKGRSRPLQPADILVVAPYNAQVRCLRERLPAGVPVGTVDKFQGQEAPVVFYSMTTSSGDDLPRGLEFLFSRNRLNVAISRARALAVLVAAPRLLDASCRSAEDMRLLNALCTYVELAAPAP